MTPLQQRMIEDMTVRGLAPSTQHAYLGFVRDTCNEVSQQESSRKVYDTCGLTGFVADRRLIIWRQTLETLSDYILR